MPNLEPGDITSSRRFYRRRCPWVGRRYRPGFVGASDKGGYRAAGHENAEPLAGSAKGFLSLAGYAAAFFVDFAAGLGAGILLAFPFSFAANSCLTVAEIASTSTL